MNEVKGYKVFNPDWTCRDYQYEVGKTFEENVRPECCERGFHFCLKASDCFNYYSFDPRNKVAEVTALGEVDSENDDSKCSTNIIRIDRELTWHEVLELVNTGKGCTGLCNSGDCNSGNRNSGDCNSGNRNSGNRNSGNRNSGDWNSGNRNSGNRNSGDCNSGDWNKASFCLGCFNTVDQKLKFFDKETSMTFSQWRNSDAYYLLSRIDDAPTEWVWASDMTDDEKNTNPDWEINDGYLKKRNTSGAIKKWWESLDSDEKEIIKHIPNFDAKKFEEITGINVDDE